MSRLSTHLAPLLQDFRANKRLRYGVFLIAMILVGELTLRWQESLGNQAQQIRNLDAELASLKQQSQDETQLRKVLEETTTLREETESRLWVVQSEAIGQARLKDWILDAATRANVPLTNITMGNASPIDPEHPTQDGYRLLSATLSFRFSPEALEKFLKEIEAGEALLNVEALTVNKREARVEINLRALISIQSPTEAPINRP